MSIFTMTYALVFGGAYVKVKVDLDLCQSHGLCVEVAPEVFELRDDGFLYLVNDAPDNTAHGKIEKAALECPTGAIALH